MDRCQSYVLPSRSTCERVGSSCKIEGASPHFGATHDLLSCLAKAMHELEVPFRKSLHCSFQANRTWLAWKLQLVEHVTHLPRAATLIAPDVRRTTQRLPAQSRGNGGWYPHLCACAMMNDSVTHSRGIARGQQRPSVAPQHLLSFDHVNASKGN